MVKWIGEGEIVPKGYAISYRDFVCLRSAVYPIPLHWLVRWWRDAVYWIATVGLPSFREATEQRMYVKGWNDAVNGYHEAWERSRQLEYARGLTDGIEQERRATLARFDALTVTPPST